MLLFTLVNDLNGAIGSTVGIL